MLLIRTKSLENQDIVPLILEIERVFRANHANQRRVRMEGMVRPRGEIEDARVEQAQEGGNGHQMGGRMNMRESGIGAFPS